MNEIIKNTKDFKIIPDTFKSAGAFDIISIEDKVINAKLKLENKEDLDDYFVGEGVEVFGVNDTGLLYFETEITKKDNYNISFNMTDDYSIIQRREYSRVGMMQGDIIFKDEAPDFIKKIEDISAGGLKIITKNALDFDKLYSVEILLSSNMKIECSVQPIRIQKSDDNYIISGKFVNINNMDRIVLVQYAFKTRMEEQSKENN